MFHAMIGNQAFVIVSKQRVGDDLCILETFDNLQNATKFIVTQTAKL